MIQELQVNLHVVTLEAQTGDGAAGTAEVFYEFEFFTYTEDSLPELKLIIFKKINYVRRKICPRGSRKR